MKRALWILWPSFIAAIAAEIAFFLLFDPVVLGFAGEILGVGHHIADYSFAFLIIWTFTAASSALTLFLQRDR